MVGMSNCVVGMKSAVSISTGRGEAHLAERDLELALVLRDLALHLDVRAGGAGGERVGEVVPHAGFKLAGLVGEGEREVLAAALAVARG
jgi:hypothetical protein